MNVSKSLMVMNDDNLYWSVELLARDHSKKSICTANIIILIYFNIITR